MYNVILVQIVLVKLLPIYNLVYICIDMILFPSGGVKRTQTYEPQF